MLPPREVLDAVGHLPDVEIDIAGAALQFARIDAPDADWTAASGHLSELARETVALARHMSVPSGGQRAAVLSALLSERHRYEGDQETYEDPANANLISVTERRRGLPVALGVIWLHCARAAGWGAHGIDFPGHFLVGLQSDPPSKRNRATSARQAVVDVFGGGVMLSAEELQSLYERVVGPGTELRPGVLAPMSTRRVLLRLQDNLRTRRLQRDDIGSALRATEDMLRIAPDHAGLWRDAGLLNQRLEQPSAAVRCFEQFLALVPAGDAAAETRATLDALRAQLN